MHIAGQFHVTHYNIGETRVNRKYCTYVSLLWPEFCILYVHLLCDKENQSLVENLNRDGFWKLEGQSLVVYWSD